MPEPTDETEIALLKREMESLTAQVAELTAQVKTLADAWNQASGAVAVVKWIVGLLAAAGGLAALVKYKLLGEHPG